LGGLVIKQPPHLDHIALLANGGEVNVDIAFIVVTDTRPLRPGDEGQ
jgi:hypothetical protein